MGDCMGSAKFYDQDMSRQLTSELSQTLDPRDADELFGPPVQTFVWDPEAFFAQNFHDPLNFNLDDNILGFFLAISTGLSMFLLTDIVFRASARAISGELSLLALRRSALISRAANPLYWVPSLRLFLRDRGRADATSTSASNDTPYLGKPLDVIMVRPRARAAVLCAGLFVCAAELLLIFLATTRATPVQIDKGKMLAFKLRARTDGRLLQPEHVRCRRKAITTRPGFESHAGVYVCPKLGRYLQRPDPNPGGVPPRRLDIATITVMYFTGSIIVDLETPLCRFHVAPDIRIQLDDGREYKTFAQADPADAAAALTEQLRQHGMSVTRLGPARENMTEFHTPNWRFKLRVRFSGLRAPENLRFLLDHPDARRPTNESRVLQGQRRKMLVWAHYLSYTMLSAFDPSATAVAIPVGGVDMSDVGVALVTKNRPWLSLGGSMIMTTLLCAIWGIISGKLKWVAGVDYDVSIQNYLFNSY